MNIRISVEQRDGWEDRGTMTLDAFLSLNEGFTPQEIEIVHSHLANVGEYIGGGGAVPFFKLERMRT